MERTANGVRGRDRNGHVFAVHFWQVENVIKKPYGCDILIETGERIPLSMGYERAKVMFNPKLETL